MIMGKGKPVDPDKLKLRMADLCARSEQCSHDVMEKLRRAGLDEDRSSDIVEFLQSNRFIDDRRFAGSFARDKVRFSGWGRNKIKAALQLRHIPTADIAEALATVPAAEYRDALMRAATAKSRDLDLDEYADRVKLMRHLASRGFTGSEAAVALEELRSDE